MLKLGMQNISALYVGGAKIKRALVGTEVVYEAVRPPAVFSISASVTPASGGSVTGAGQYREGDTVTLTYTPAEDHRFTGWYAGNTLLSQANPYTFTAAQDMSITARCEVVPTYTLTLTPTGISAQNWSFSILVNGSGATWSGSGASPSSPAPNPVSVKEGSVTVEATSPDGYEFAGWQIGSGSVVTSNPYTFTITGDTTLYCRYAKKSRLPAGYTEVAYIQPATKTSYLDTGLRYNSSSSAPSTTVFDVELTGATAGTSHRFITYAFSIAGKTRYCCRVYANSSGIYGVYLTSNVSSSPPGERITRDNSARRFTITCTASDKKVTIGNDSITVTSFYANDNINLGGDGSSTYTTNTLVRFYGVKTTSASTSSFANGELVPCKDPSGKVGMYDIIRNVFVAGVGTWTAGPAV